MSEQNRHRGEGEPFFPGHLLKESVVMLATILVVMFLALTISLPAESVADPTDSTYQPRPEWYFLFLFQFLKYFPGSMEVIAAVVLPAIGLGALIFLPFLDKNPARHPKQRPLATSSAIITVLGIIVLTILGLDDGKQPSGQSFTFFEKWRYGMVLAIIAINFLFTMLIVSKRSPIKDGISKLITASVVAVMSGLALVTVVVFSMLQPQGVAANAPGGTAAPGKVIIQGKCLTCHAFDGKGGPGPDLAKGSSKYKTVDQLTKFLHDPASAGSVMPKQQLTEQEIKDVAEFLTPLSGGGATAASGAAQTGSEAKTGENKVAETKTGEGKTAGGETKAGTEAGTSGDPNVIRLGQKTFEANSCQSCHAINGKGGAFGPELSKIGAKRDLQWLTDYLKDPKSVMPDTQMPIVPLSKEEVNAIAAYLATLK